MASPAPKSPEQSDKSKKYDRQLRLWGDHGQNALEVAKVCLINATGVGTEILKSLVLPGIGAFTIVDGKKVTDDDIGSNFFLDTESYGKSRAQICTQLLLELNPDVHGDYVDENVEQLLENSPDFFNNFNIVIGSNVNERVILPLSKKFWELDIPFIICKSYGFIGYIRVQVKEHCVVETHPDNQMPDLRLDNPFPELRDHFELINIENMDLKDHAHVPYVVILYKYLQKWRENHGGQLPSNYKEKDSLRNMIRSGILLDEHGNYEMEENFEEAIKAVNYAIIPAGVPKHIQDILDDDSCINLTSKSSPFWIMCKALRDFVENEGAGCLPVRGSLPDMTAETNQYVTLQQLYNSQAAKDADIVYRRVQQLLHQLNQPADTISEKDVKLFCKHASSLYVCRGTSIAEEYDAKSSTIQRIASNLENPESLMVYYLMLRGIDRFFTDFNTFPGELDDQVEPDIVKLKTCISKLLSEWSCVPLAKDDYLHEICRYGGAELHSVSAFLGGCAAQEAIKFITFQYKPINNTFIYDAITSSTAMFSI